MLKQRAAIVRRMYCADPRPWIVAFSGGKDSTATLQLIWLAIGDLPRTARQKPIHVCFVDTGMDHPLYADQARETIKKIERAAILQQMPFRVHTLRPQMQHRYWVALVGRGYAPPTHWFRWCTKSMRVKPLTEFVKSTVSADGEVVVVLGLRRDESASRATTLDKFATAEPFVGRVSNFRNATAFTPIEDFRAEEVWQFLTQVPCPWGTQNRELVRLYNLARGECLSYSLRGNMAPSCGGSRFGCWTCTVVRKDKAGEGLADHDERYQHLVDFRDWLGAMRYEPHRRWKRRRNGQPGPGPLRMQTRREILTRLLAIQADTGFALIEPQEILAIQRFWDDDGDRHRSAITMATQFGIRQELGRLRVRHKKLG